MTRAIRSRRAAERAPSVCGTGPDACLSEEIIHGAVVDKEMARLRGPLT